MSVVIRRLQGQHSTPSNKLRILLNEQHNVLLKKALEDEEAAQLTVEILYVALAISSLMEEPRYRTDEGLQLASRATTIALSVHTSTTDLMLGSIEAREGQFNATLEPLVERIRKALTDAHLILIKLSDRGLFTSRDIQLAATRCLKDLHAANAAFAMRIAFLSSHGGHTSNHSHKDTDGLHLIPREVQIQRACDPLYLQNLPPTYHRLGVMEGSQKTFWDNTSEAMYEDKRVIIKQYSGAAEFTKDLEILKRARYTYLPSLFGHSSSTSKNPFIVLAMPSFVPFLKYLPILCETSPGTAVVETWKMLASLHSTCEYLVRKGFVTDWYRLRLLIQESVVDDRGKIIMPSTSVDSEEDDIGGFTNSWLFTIEGVDALLVDFYGQDNSATRTAFSAEFAAPDPTPRLLRPLRYAMARAPKKLLSMQPAQISSLEDPLSVLSQWRVGPQHIIGSANSKRALLWRVEYDPHLPVTAGDVGFLFNSHSGKLCFERLCNVQREMGGYELQVENGEAFGNEVSQGIWHISRNALNKRRMRYSPLIKSWTFNVPLQVCYRYMADNGARLGIEYGVAPDDLVLINRVYYEIQASPPPVVAEDWGVFVHFDANGRLIALYSSTSSRPTDISLLSDSLAYNPSNLIRINHFSANYIQLEPDEIMGTSHYSERNMPSCVRLGDLGYLLQYDIFKPLINARALMSNYQVQPWQQNPCTQLSKGIWRSPAFVPETEDWVCYTWDVVARRGIPHDLNHFLAEYLVQGNDFPFRSWKNQLEIVSGVTHQVYGRVQTNGQASLWLFTHFNDFGDILSAYWSTSDTPRSSLLPSEELPGCTVLVRPEIAKSYSYPRIFKRDPIDVSLGLDAWEQLTQEDEGKQVLAWTDRLSIAPGDITFDSRTPSPDGIKPVELSYPNALFGPPIIHHYFYWDDVPPCEEISKGLWRVATHGQIRDLAGSSPTGVIKLHYRWISRPSFRAQPNKLESFSQEFTNKYGDTLQITTCITTDVYATVTQEACLRYLLTPWDKSRLSLYVYFSPCGKAFTYWSRDEFCNPDPVTLSMLDLEHWSLQGCRAVLTRTSEKVPLARFIALNGSILSCPVQAVRGREVGDVGFIPRTDGGMHCCDITWVCNIRNELGTLVTMLREGGCFEETLRGWRLIIKRNQQRSYKWKTVFGSDSTLAAGLQSALQRLSVDCSIPEEDFVINMACHTSASISVGSLYRDKANDPHLYATVGGKKGCRVFNLYDTPPEQNETINSEAPYPEGLTVELSHTFDYCLAASYVISLTKGLHLDGGGLPALLRRWTVVDVEDGIFSLISRPNNQGVQLLHGDVGLWPLIESCSAHYTTLV